MLSLSWLRERNFSAQERAAGLQRWHDTMISNREELAKIVTVEAVSVHSISHHITYQRLEYRCTYLIHVVCFTGESVARLQK